MLDLMRERSMSVGDAAWEAFTSQARRMGLDTSQALTAALRQWVVLAPGPGFCPHCGAVLCDTDHHTWWCEDSRNVEAADDRARGAYDLRARALLAPAQIQQQG